MVKIAEVMTADPVCVRATSTLRHCLRQLLTHGVRHLPVLDDVGRLLGLVHDFQVLRHCTRGKVPVLRPELADTPALRVAVSAGKTASPDGSLLELIDLLTDRWEEAVVVVDEEKHPVGIFSQQDALRLAGSWLTPWWRVRQSMVVDDFVLSADLPARQGLRKLWDAQKAHAMVFDGDRLLGAVSLRELVGVDPESDATLREVSRRLRVVGPDTAIVDAAHVMAVERRACLPVLVDERPAGLFTSACLLRAMRRSVNVATTRAS